MLTVRASTASSTPQAPPPGVLGKEPWSDSQTAKGSSRGIARHCLEEPMWSAGRTALCLTNT